MVHEQLAASDDRHIRERLTAIPIFQALGFHSVELSRGTASAVVPRQTQFDGILHTYHGGLLMTVADSVAAIAVLTVAGPSAQIATSQMSITLLRPATHDVRAVATVLRRGRRLIPCVVELFEGERQVAFAQVTYVLTDADGRGTLGIVGNRT